MFCNAHRLRLAFTMLCLTSTLQLLGCGGADDITLSREILVHGGAMKPHTIAPAKDRADVYYYAGQSIYGESAVAVHLPEPGGGATVLWRYDRDPRRARMKGGVYFAGGSRPTFRGLVPMSDGSVFLCGDGPGDHGKDRPALLVRLDNAGRVISEDEVLPPKTTEEGTKLGGGQKVTVIGGFDRCLTWGNDVVALGTAHYYGASVQKYHWVVVANSAGQIVWQKLVRFDMKFWDEFVTVRVTPRSLFFTRLLNYAGDTSTDIVSMSRTGDLVAHRQLRGFYVAVSSDGEEPLRIVGGDQSRTKSLITLGEDLRETSREDGLATGSMAASAAYDLDGSALLLFGFERPNDQSSVRYSSASYVDKQRSVRSRLFAPWRPWQLLLGGLRDYGTVVSARTQRPGEFIIARNLYKNSVFSFEGLGLALNFVGAPPSQGDKRRRLSHVW